MKTSAQTQKDDQLAAFAAHLKKERLRQGRSILRTAKSLAIDRERLIALENWQENNLPPHSHRVGLLNTYADLLQVESIGKKSGRNSSQILLRTSVKTRILSRAIVGGIASVAVLTTIGYLVVIGRSYIAKPPLAINEPAVDTSVLTSSVKVVGKTSKQTIVRVDGQPITVGDDGVFSSEIFIRPGENTITVSAINSLGRQSVVQRHVYR